MTGRSLRRCATSVAVAILAVQTVSVQPLDPTAALLAELIRANTTNPPGNEGLIGGVLEPRFRALGFEIDVVLTPEPGKSHFIARLRGNGSRRPLLLAAHADVVGVEREKWTLDPFAGIVRDGYVFGRGALDFKGGMAVFARAAMMLAERNVPLARDVIFLAEADEEMGRYNTTWLAEHHWDKIDCEFSLNEGGWIVKRDAGGVRYVSISTADKISVGVVLTVRGTSTHSSMPKPDSAIFALARALAKLADHETDVTLTPGTRRFFEMLARTSSPPMSDHFRDLTSGDRERVRRADRIISNDPLLHAIMRNTIAPVLMNAGFRANVIPGSAEATVNVRLLPGTEPAAMLQEIARVIDNPAVELTFANPPAAAAPASSEDTDLYRALEKQARQRRARQHRVAAPGNRADLPDARRRGRAVTRGGV